MIEFLIGLLVVASPIAIVYGLGFLTLKIISASDINTEEIFCFGIAISFLLCMIIFLSYFLYLIGGEITIYFEQLK